jgi:radical SAM protein with 4Fe4S-binding SPASM domain
MDFISPWIHTTEKCNLKCHYCYVKGKAVMTKEIYNALGKLLVESPKSNKHLRFAGGEPLLVFDEWEWFARDMLKHKGVTIEILTNLRAPSPHFWRFAELENVNISVSVDNGKTVKVLDHLLSERLRMLRNPWLMTTVTNENINSLDVLAAFVGMNNYGWAITTDYFEKTTPDWETLAEAMLGVVAVLKEFNYDFTKVSFNNFSAKSGFSGCRAGNEMFSVGCDGTIYKCQTLIGNGKGIGSVFKGYKRTECPIKPECKVCSIYGLCKGWCQLYYKTPNPICNVIKLFANEVIKEVRAKHAHPSTKSKEVNYAE